ncbi:MAG: metal-dependent transcriptional regulator [Bacteroidia bacterium]|nr:metal-dependent transcriptional regulator [Bacteroidia bacterium]
MNELTVAEEHYLKALYLCRPDGGETTVKALAARLAASQPSVAEMLKRLQAKQLLEYRPYRGIKLTEKGRMHALRVVRAQRLWEVFLVEKLRMSWDEVHEATEELEHVRSQKVVERLDEFLGFPRFDPHGDPIPDGDGRIRCQEGQPLSGLEVGEKAAVVGVLLHSTPFLRLLERLGLKIGVELTVLERFEFDSTMIVALNSGPLTLAKSITDHISVQRR